MTAGLRPGQVAAASGVNLQTLRYYERRGLLPAPDRTLGGHRIYPARSVTLVRVIKTAQRLGFSLTEVADLLETGTHHHGRRDAGLQAKARAKVAEIDQKIQDLTVIRESLSQALDAGCDDLVACAGNPSRCPLPFVELTTGRQGPASNTRPAAAGGAERAFIIHLGCA